MTTMQLWVKDKDNKTHTIDCDSSEPIENIRCLIQERLNTTDEVVLIFSGKALEDGRSLADYNIGHQAHRVGCVLRDPAVRTEKAKPQAAVPTPAAASLHDASDGGDGGEAVQPHPEAKDTPAPLSKAISQHGVLNDAAAQKQQQKQRLMGVTILGLLDAIKVECIELRKIMPDLAPQAAFSYTATVVSKCAKNQLGLLYADPERQMIPATLVETIQSYIAKNEILLKLYKDPDSDAPAFVHPDFVARMKTQLGNPNILSQENQLRQEFGVSQSSVDQDGGPANDGGGHIAEAKESFPMQIPVKSLSGQTHYIDCHSRDTMEHLKELIRAKTGMTGDFRLHFAGKQLEDGRSLDDYNITKYGNPTIYCMPAPTAQPAAPSGGCSMM